MEQNGCFLTKKNAWFPFIFLASTTWPACEQESGTVRKHQLVPRAVLRRELIERSPLAMADGSKSTSARAPPRRARKDPNEAPVFLQKTYQMIDTVRGNICHAWTSMHPIISHVHPPSTYAVSAKHSWLVGDGRYIRCQRHGGVCEPGKSKNVNFKNSIRTASKAFEEYSFPTPVRTFTQTFAVSRTSFHAFSSTEISDPSCDSSTSTASGTSVG